jgi:hypothetical protein
MLGEVGYIGFFMYSTPNQPHTSISRRVELSNNNTPRERAPHLSITPRLRPYLVELSIWERCEERVRESAGLVGVSPSLYLDEHLCLNGIYAK